MLIEAWEKQLHVVAKQMLIISHWEMWGGTASLMGEKTLCEMSSQVPREPALLSRTGPGTWKMRQTFCSVLALPALPHKCRLLQSFGGKRGEQNLLSALVLFFQTGPTSVDTKAISQYASFQSATPLAGNTTTGSRWNPFLLGFWTYFTSAVSKGSSSLSWTTT